jgi:hypothetical protein
MNKTIYKYPIKITDMQNVIIPLNAEILSLQAQDDVPCIWALVDPKEKETRAVNLETFGTGHTIHCDMGTDRKFIATYQTKGLVFHVFEYTGV